MTVSPKKGKGKWSSTKVDENLKCESSIIPVSHQKKLDLLK